MNPNTNLAVVTDIPKQKTVADYQQEMTVLEQEAASCQQLINNIPSLRMLAQRATTENIVGRATVADVDKAQAALDDALAALSRKDALARAIGETNDALIWQRGVERRQFCESVAAEYQTAYDRYLQLCNDTLATFKKLQALSNKHAGLTARHLLDQYQSDLNLPALYGPNDMMKATIPTGRR